MVVSWRHYMCTQVADFLRSSEFLDATTDALAGITKDLRLDVCGEEFEAKFHAGRAYSCRSCSFANLRAWLNWLSECCSWLMDEALIASRTSPQRQVEKDFTNVASLHGCSAVSESFPSCVSSSWSSHFSATCKKLCSFQCFRFSFLSHFKDPCLRVLDAVTVCPCCW